MSVVTSFLMCLCQAAAAVTPGETTTYALAPAMRPVQADIEAALARQTYPSGPRPPILLLILDTLRADYVTDGLMPALSDFCAAHAIARRTWAAATATDHSLFSVLHVRPAYEREQAYAQTLLPTSIPLGLLKRAGYAINLFAYPHWYACPPAPSARQPPSPWSNLASFELLYGTAGHMLARCPHAVRDAVDVQHSLDADRTLVAQYLASIDARQHATAEGPSFDVLHLYGAHDPYGIDTQSPKLYKPYFDGTLTNGVIGTHQRLPTAQSRQQLKHTYANSVISLDATFDMLLTGLRDRHAFDDRIIIVFSDHGEALPDDAVHPCGHGLDPTGDQAAVISAYKSLHPQDAPPVVDSASITSLLPTLLDDLHLLADTDSALTARFSAPSLLAPLGPADGPPCLSIVRPNGAKPPVRMALADGRYKVMLTILERDADGSPSLIRPEALTDMHDVPIAEEDMADHHAILRQLLACLQADLN